MPRRIEVEDPFISGRLVEIEPEAIIRKCKALWESRGKDHAYCRWCQELRTQVENLVLLSALDPEPVGFDVVEA